MQPKKALKHSDRSNGLAEKTHTPKIVSVDEAPHAVDSTSPQVDTLPPRGKSSSIGNTKIQPKKLLLLARVESRLWQRQESPCPINWHHQ